VCEEKSSANTVQRTRCQNNALIQTTLIEAAKMPPAYQSGLGDAHDKENRKAMRIAHAGGGKKAGGYLMAVDRGQREFSGDRDE